jgi:hypothetical protein
LDGDPVVTLTLLSSTCRFSHDSIATCSRDGTAIIWMLQSLNPNVNTIELLNVACYDVFNASRLMLLSLVIPEENVTLECSKMWMKSVSVQLSSCALHYMSRVAQPKRFTQESHICYEK